MAMLPLFPKNPDRVCWGCDKYCPAESLACGKGTVRTQHPMELFGQNWLAFEGNSDTASSAEASEEPRATETCDLLAFDDLGRIRAL